MAAAVAAWHQRGIGSGGTINNQLKALAATASEMATMTAITKTIKTKVAAAAAAWQQRGGGGISSAAAAEAKAAAGATARRRRRQCGGGRQRDGSIGSALAAVAAPRQSFGDSVAAAA